MQNRRMLARLVERESLSAAEGARVPLHAGADELPRRVPLPRMQAHISVARQHRADMQRSILL